MAATATGRVALFSIRPQYADAILTGSKEVEFRRTALAADVSHVVIYATTPVRKVVGAFEVAGVDAARPAALWESYGPVGGIQQSDYMDYFEGTESAYAIKVRHPRRWDEPLTLEELSPGLRAPQSYQYLRNEALAKVTPMLTEQRVPVLNRLGTALREVVKAVAPGLARSSGTDSEPMPCR